MVYTISTSTTQVQEKKLTVAKQKLITTKSTKNLNKIKNHETHILRTFFPLHRFSSSEQ